MILAADNLNPANAAVAGALKNLDPQPLQALARRCQDAGARLLDLNPGYLAPRREDRITFMVDAVQAVTSLPLILDSPNPGVLARGLAACRDKPLLNALTREEKKLAEILPLAVEHQTDLVLLLLDERSFPPPVPGRENRPGGGTPGTGTGRRTGGKPPDLRPGPPEPQLAGRLAPGGGGN